MSAFGFPLYRAAVALAACSALLAVPAAAAAPPASDGQGFVDSTARCATPDVAVAFGATATSRVAICKTPGGQYQYRGVRVRDGAKLIVGATSAGGGEFVATRDGFAYTVTPESLKVGAGDRVIRTERWVEFHGSDAPAAAPAPTSRPAAPTATQAPAPPVDPLPAEVGGSGS